MGEAPGGKPHNEAERVRRGGNWAADRALRAVRRLVGEGGVPRSALWAWAEEVWGPVCAECTPGRGCVDAGVGGCVQQGVECGGGGKGVQSGRN